MYKFIPKSIGQKGLNMLRNTLASYWKKKIANMPVIELSQEHIENVEMLLDRDILLQKMPKNAIVAELGVDKGGFSEKILQTCQPKKLHLVDLWGSKRYGTDKQNAVRKKFENEIQASKLEIK